MLAKIFLPNRTVHALILAGGFATRLWPLTEKRPKPLIPIAGKPLLSFLVEKIPEYIPITISTNAIFEQDFLDWKKFFPERNIEIFVEDSFGEQQKKGALAATALFVQEKNLQEDLLLLAGDNFFGFSFDDFFAAYHHTPILAAYDVKDKNEAKKFGVLIPEKHENTVKAFEEKPENPSSTLVSTGAYIFPKKHFDDIVFYSKNHADDLGGIFEYFLQKKIVVSFFPFAEKWYDIGSFPAFLEANMDLLDGKNVVEEGVQIDENTILEGGVFLQKNVKLENVIIKNSVVLENTHLKNTQIENCVIGKNVIIQNTDVHGKIVRDETVMWA